MPFQPFVLKTNDRDHYTRLAGYLGALSVNKLERH
jgi:hypothetical protein